MSDLWIHAQDKYETPQDVPDGEWRVLGMAVRASRSDVLEWLGWEKCEKCGGSGHDLSYGPPHEAQGVNPPGRGTACTYCACDCLDGLVPPASLVTDLLYATDEVTIRAALIAAMEGVGDE